MRNLRICTVCLAFTICLFGSPPISRPQTATATEPPLAPGPEPSDVSTEWKQLVGIYGRGEEEKILLENSSRLFWKSSTAKTLDWIADLKKDGTIHITPPVDCALSLILFPQQNAEGDVIALKSGTVILKRADAGSDPSHFYHVTPVRPLEQVRSIALRASPPPEQGPFRATELVELATMDSTFHLDIRYAQSNNFLSAPIYSQARAFLQRPAAEALLRVQRKLQPLGYGLLIHDAYRPWYVTKIFWEATPPEGHNFVADPAKGSKHNRGCAVDLTLYESSTSKPIQMPGLYDEMSPRSFPTFPGGTSLQRWHRDLLRRAMESEGFTVNDAEWWHFDYKDWKQYAIGNVPFEKLRKE